MKFDVRRMYEPGPTSHSEAWERIRRQRQEELERSNRRTSEIADLILTLAAVGAGTTLYAAAWVVLRLLGMVA